MKKYLLSLLTLTLLFCEASFTGGGMAFAADVVGTEWSTTNYTYTVLSLNPATVSIKVASGKNPSSINTGNTVIHSNTTYSITTIPANAFQNCTNITSVTIGTNITSISASAFSGCTNITKVTWNATNYSSSIGSSGGFQASKSKITSFVFGNDVTRIPAYLCYNFSNLESVVIPANVGTINNYAFNGCSKLTEVLVKPSSVPTLGASPATVFPSCANIYVEDEDLYKSSWTNYASKITSTVEGSCGTNATWSLNLATGVMTISGTGAMTDYTYNANTGGNMPWWNNYRPYIQSIVVEDGITRIGNYAFYSCSAALTSVTIPTSVTSIGTHAFDGCTKLNLDGAYYAGTVNQWCGITFDDESANPIYKARKLYVNNDQLLTNAFISAATINAYAFTYDEALESVEFTYAVKTVGNSAFNSCTNISSVNYTSTINNWCGISFGNYNSNPASKSHGLKLNGTLQNSISLTTNIGAFAFYGNTELTSVTLSYNVKSIGSDAFNGCTNIGTVNYTSTVDNWCEISFANFSSNPVYYSHSLYLSNNLLTSANISATSIGQYAFNKNTSLTSVNLTKAVTIGNSAFASTGLTGELLLPNSLTEIGTNGFDGCASLTSITFASEQAGLTTIGGYAFRNCSTLVSLMIPQNVTTIGTTAFSGCSSLASIIACPSAAPTAGSSALYNVPTSIPVYVPSSSARDAYKAATHWKNFTNYQIMTTHSGTCGTNMNWELNMQTGELTISGTGKVMNDYEKNSNKSPWRTYSSSIKYLTIPAPIQHIGNYAFYNCSTIKKINYTGSGTTYNSSIGEGAFWGCSNITGTIIIGAGVQTIGPDAFHSCSSVENFSFTNFASNNATYPSQKQLTTIGNNAFTYCSSATFSGLWNNSSTQLLTTIGNGAFMYCSTPTSLTIPNSVTTIGNYAFYEWNFSSITIPANVTSIGKSAFAGNASLRTVTWKATSCDNFSVSDDYEHPFYVSSDDKFQITSFSFDNAVTTLPSYICYGMDNITSITLPTNLTAIPAYAFKGCSALTKVGTTNKTITIPSGITSIGGYAFDGCTLIEHINLTAATSLGSIGINAFRELTAVSGELYIPSSVTSIGTSAFDGISGITSITADPLSPPTAYSSSFDDFDKSIPVYLQASANPVSYATATGWKDFYNMSMTGYCGAEDGGHNLTWTYTPINATLTISGTGAMQEFGSASVVPWYSFRSAIKAIEIESGVTTIGNYAFYGCNNELFTSIFIPEGVTSIGNSAFQGCTHLASVTLPSTLLSIGSSAFHSNAFTSISIPSSVSTISSYAFKNCANLTSIVVPNITTLNEETFSGCSSLESVTLPNSLITIKQAAFFNCSSLTSITIPENVTTVTCHNNSTVYTSTFDGCSSLQTVVWNARSVTSGITRVGKGANSYDYATPFDGIKTQITSFTFGPNVETIPNYLCRGMNNESFTSVTIPAKVTSIGEETFDGCTHLTTVTSNAIEKPSISSSTFPSSVESTATLYVPATVASRTAYSEDTYWGEFAHMLPYIISFNMKDHGDAIDPICVNAGRVDEALQPADPTEDYYTFGGWYSNEGCTTPFTFGESGTVVNGDLTLYAKWTIYNYQVTFDLQGHGSSIAAQTIDHNGLVSKPDDPSADYYTFGGWYKEAGCSNAWDFSEDHITAATTLYAKWTRADLTLNDNADNSDALTEYDGESTNVNLMRSLISASYNTICLPFAMTAAQVESAFGANCDIEELTRASYADGNLKLFFTKRTAIEAGKPYLIQPKADVANPVIAGVTIDNTARPSIFDGVTFHGIFSRTVLANSEDLLFLGASNTLYMSSGGQMKGMRGYFELTTPQAQAAARRSARIILHEEGATGIEETITNDQSPITNKIIRDGQLFILRDGKTYNAQGALIK